MIFLALVLESEFEREIQNLSPSEVKSMQGNGCDGKPDIWITDAEFWETSFSFLQYIYCINITLYNSESIKQ